MRRMRFPQNDCLPLLWLTLLFLCLGAPSHAQPAPFHVLLLYSTNTEADHVAFAQQAIPFFEDMAKRDHFDITATTDWNSLNQKTLAHYQLVLWLDDTPSTPAQRAAFENYMQHGGGWLGFHIAGYQPSREAWPWFADFLGAIFSGNNWPPLPARIDVDTPQNPTTAGMPASFLSPANEWYSWSPSPRSSPHIQVLMTLDPASYPIGFKNTLGRGDIPVVWTNTQYRMLYVNMGHGSHIFDSPLQSHFFENSILWLAGRKK